MTMESLQVSTMAISVQTLTLGKRQVTLSIFRQFVKDNLIAYDGTLRGRPIGWVNYHPDKECADLQDDDHWHVVWTPDEDLVRVSNVERLPAAGFFHAFAGDDLIWASARESWFQGRRSRNLSEGSPVGFGYRHDVDVYGLPTDAAVRLSRISRMVREYAAGDDESQKWFHPAQIPGLEGSVGCWISASAMRRALVHVGDELADSGSDRPSGFCLDRVDREVEAEAARRQRHRNIRESIGDMPQLFIAV